MAGFKLLMLRYWSYLDSPERDLQVLSSPDVHLHVVLAELGEVLAVHAEQPPSYHGGADHLGGVTQPSAAFGVSKVFPLE